MGSKQVYSRDELVDSVRAESLLGKHDANALISNLKVNDAVTGFAKRATVFSLLGVGMERGIHKKTLVELRFKAEQDADVLKIVESIPKSMAKFEDIELTQGGVFAEKDPVIIFTFNDVKQGTALKAVYVVKKGLSTLDTMTFAAEEKVRTVKPTVAKVCGDGKCVEGETYLSCCADCGCLPGFVCKNNVCGAADRDKCKSDTDCSDDDPMTKDTCSGTPKTCSNTLVVECLSDDGFCPAGCDYDKDTDCPEPEVVEEEEEVDVSLLNITGDQESPKIGNITIIPGNVSIGGQILIEAAVSDANGKDDVERVWFEVLELAQTHGEKGDMNDAGKDGDMAAGDGRYTALQDIGEHYLTGWYHMNVFAKDRAGNKKKQQRMFQVKAGVGNVTS
jgi:hypothetical protein